jgi:hypothetical protein
MIGGSFVCLEEIRRQPTNQPTNQTVYVRTLPGAFDTFEFEIKHIEKCFTELHSFWLPYFCPLLWHGCQVPCCRRHESLPLVCQ